jgi:protoporphyrinogen oxidase
MNAVMPKRNQKEITSLIEEFQYPKYGPGMMWERCTEKVLAKGCTVEMETRVVGIRHEGGKAVAVIAQKKDGTRTEYPCDHVISSMPISQLLKAFDPPPSPVAVQAADDLRYRDFITVALVVPEKYSFPDNWIYVHAPGVQVGRIQNFGSWSPYLIKEGRTCLGLEFFVFEGDSTWTKPDEELIAQGTRELGILNRPSGRAQRHAPLQQPGPLDVHGHAHRREHRHRLDPRRVERQRGGGVPRGVLRHRG